jgi:prefoldin beta subunit
MEKEEAGQLLNQAQLYSQQIQNIIAQKTALVLELNEMKRALEEVRKTKEKFVFKLSGPIMIKVDTAELKKEFEERESLASLRIKTLEKQEVKLKEKIDELRTKIIKVRPAKAESEEEAE